MSVQARVEAARLHSEYLTRRKAAAREMFETIHKASQAAGNFLASHQEAMKDMTHWGEEGKRIQAELQSLELRARFLCDSLSLESLKNR